MNTDHLLAILRRAPVGFGIDETRVWLEGVNEIQSFSEVESVFLKWGLSYIETRALIALLQDKYISASENLLFDGRYEDYIKQHKFVESQSGLSISGDTSSVLDFSLFDKKLLKLKLFAVRKANVIILPKNPAFEALRINCAPKLTEIKNIECIEGLKFLSIDRCKAFLDFEFIEKLNNLYVLGISGNNRLPELDFLGEKSKIRILHLAETNAMKLKNTIDNLSKLKNLRYLSIRANQKELKLLREHFPACAINGASLNEVREREQNSF